MPGRRCNNFVSDFSLLLMLTGLSLIWCHQLSGGVRGLAFLV